MNTPDKIGYILIGVFALQTFMDVFKNRMKLHM